MKDWIALNMTPGVGSRVTARLLEHFGSAEAIFDAPRRELALLRLPLETVESIVSRELHERAEREIESVRKLGGDILVLDDGVYPALLRETYDPPVVLYVKGAWADCLERPCIAMVGSRRCSTYGQNAALMLSRELAQRGVTIISGLARGIDAASNHGASGDGTEPRSLCRPRQHYLAEFVRHQLFDQRRGRQAGATMAGHCRRT